MSTLFVILALPFIVMVFHPKTADHGKCAAKEGSYKALLCPVKKP